MKNLSTKTALITGAAQGLGREIAIRMAEAGSHLFLIDRQEEKLLAFQAELRRRFPESQFECFCCDLSNEGAATESKKAFLEKFSSLDVLVNNAGVVFGGRFDEVELDRHRQTFCINTLALVEFCYEFLALLKKQEEAVILNISSVTGYIGLPDGATYAASKWAVTGFSESLRRELIKSGFGKVAVKIVCPSYIATGMFDGSRPPQLLPFLYAEPFSHKILRLVQSKRTYLREPFLVKFVPFLRGILPLWAEDWLLERLGVTTSMQSWRGHKEGQH